MAKSFSTGNVKEIVNSIKNAEIQLQKIEDFNNKTIENIKIAGEKVKEKEAKKHLKSVSIDHLNSNQEGFRIKTLRDNGFENIADILSANIPRLTSINGISQDSAKQIKDKAKTIADNISENIKVGISVDNKTPELTELLKCVYTYINYKDIFDRCNEIKKYESTGFKEALKDVVPATKTLGWIFTSKEKKEKATNAYNYLKTIYEGSYCKDANTLYSQYKMLYSAPDNNKIWEDFSNNPIIFINTIERIIPDLLGENRDNSGLPQELAKVIDEVSINLEGLKCTLRSYQEMAVKYILHQERVLLGDEMGLGKTVQAIATMVSLKNSQKHHFVVVCPASVLANWIKEITNHSELEAVKIHGADKEESLEYWKRNGGVAVTTYETTSMFSLSDKFRFGMLVVDEAHYIKNPSAKRTINVKRLCTHAERLLFMTGTAMENNVEEMIELIKILQPNVAEKVKELSFMASAPEFREKIAPVYFRRKREDVLKELPELIETREWVLLNPEEETIYENSVLEGNFPEARRVSWNIDDLRKSSKAQRLQEIIDEAESEGRKVIVFTFFLKTAEKISEYFGNRCSQAINGSVTPQRRQEIIDEFDKAPAGSILLAQIQAGGTGLNIQSASVVVICEPQFKPSIENQAISRAYRMGQTRNVLVYRLLCDDTVDERITDILKDKQTLFDAFADKSTSAENLEIDESSFNDIIHQEAERIKAKNHIN